MGVHSPILSKKQQHFNHTPGLVGDWSPMLSKKQKYILTCQSSWVSGHPRHVSGICRKFWNHFHIRSQFGEHVELQPQGKYTFCVCLLLSYFVFFSIWDLFCSSRSWNKRIWLGKGCRPKRVRVCARVRAQIGNAVYWGYVKNKAKVLKRLQ